MEAAVQTNQVDRDPAGYAKVARVIIKEILSCKKMSNQIKCPQMQLNVTQWSAVKVNRRLDKELGNDRDREVAYVEAGSQFPDALVFDSKQPKE